MRRSRRSLNRITLCIMPNRRYIAGFFVLSALAGTLWFAGAAHTHAMVMRGGENYDLPNGTLIDGDLYAAGRDVTLGASTTGDVLAAASALTLSGTTSQDALLAGGRVSVSGPVGGDLRVVGGQVAVQSTVGEDALLAGGTVVVASGTIIHGDLLIFADTVVMDGTVDGQVEIHAHTIEWHGSAAGNVSVTASDSLTLSGAAHIVGSLTYQAPRAAVIDSGVVIDGGTHFELLENTGGQLGFDLFGFMVNMLIAVIAAVLLVVLFPAFTRRAVEVAFTDGSLIALKGFGLLIAWPIAGLLVLVTVLGALPGLLLLCSYGIAVFLAMTLTPVLAGAMLAQWLKKEDGLRPAWASLGAIVIVLITALPVIGWLVRFILFLLAFGTICALAYRSIWQKRKDDGGGTEEEATTASTDTGTAADAQHIDDKEADNDEKGRT